ncbi:MAG: hypothetical protein MJA29_00365 [Candidatus Omnitrophica bacterium]|nr:hypothetical protein [Candidatus Omnitrophota bacterium]
MNKTAQKTRLGRNGVARTGNKELFYSNDNERLDFRGITDAAGTIQEQQSKTKIIRRKINKRII